MLTEFDDIIDKVLAHEGGYVNDPDDPGGETKFGISKRAFPDVDIKELTREDAKKLYKEYYWERYRAGDLPDTLRYIYFDMCINIGYRGSVKILQRACNSKNKEDIDVDGGIGRMTLKASLRVEDWRLRAYRVKYYADLVSSKPKLEKYWVGWFRRSCEV